VSGCKDIAPVGIKVIHKTLDILAQMTGPFWELDQQFYENVKGFDFH
jgi:hypothetical protein